MAGTPISSIDGLIAATAHTHNLVVVTRNVEDFRASGVPVYDPWGKEVDEELGLTPHF